MKQVLKSYSFKMLAMSLLFALMQLIVFAQDSNGGGATTSGTSSTTTKSVDVTNASTDSNWYASPWVWVVGAALFILLLVALLGGSKGRSATTTSTSTTAADRGDRMTVQKTTRTDTDTDL